MAGLIDRLDSAEWVRSGMSEYDRAFDGKTVRVKDLRAMLRSDETREALARAICESSVDIWDEGSRHYYLADADAVVRVLTGEGGDRG